MTAKHPRRYYNVTVSNNNGEADAYGHLSKLNVANLVKMALDSIEDAPDVSLYIRVVPESKKLTRILESRNLGRNLHDER